MIPPSVFYQRQHQLPNVANHTYRPAAHRPIYQQPRRDSATQPKPSAAPRDTNYPNRAQETSPEPPSIFQEHASRGNIESIENQKASLKVTLKDNTQAPENTLNRNMADSLATETHDNMTNQTLVEEVSSDEQTVLSPMKDDCIVLNASTDDTETESAQKQSFLNIPSLKHTPPDNRELIDVEKLANRQ